MTSQPLGSGPGGREQEAGQETAHGSAPRDFGKKRGGNGWENRETCGQSRDCRDRHRPKPLGLDVETFRDPRNPETELAKTKRPADEESAPEGEIAKTDKQRGIGNGNKQEKRERRESQNGQRPGDETKRHPRKKTVAQSDAVQNFRLHDLIERRALIHAAASKSPTPLTTNTSAKLKAGQCVVPM